MIEAKIAFFAPSNQQLKIFRFRQENRKVRALPRASNPQTIPSRSCGKRPNSTVELPSLTMSSNTKRKRRKSKKLKKNPGARSTESTQLVFFVLFTICRWTVANKGVSVTETTYIVTGLTHNAEYRFRISAENFVGVGAASSASKLFKIAAPVKPEPPVVKESLKDTTVGLKQSVTLSCIIVGVPQPTLRWYKNDNEFKPSKASYEAGTARLVFDKTSEEVAGRYTCSAENDSGTVETSCELIVQEPPKIEPSKKAKIQRVKRDTKWSFTAKISGLPRPDIIWTKNGVNLDSDSRYINDAEVVSSTLITTTVTIVATEKCDAATYALTATNKCGTSTHEIKLKIMGKTIFLRNTLDSLLQTKIFITDKPGTPEGPLVIKEVDKNFATLEWQPPTDKGGVELTGYAISYCEVSKNDWKKVTRGSRFIMKNVANFG